MNRKRHTYDHMSSMFITLHMLLVCLYPNHKSPYHRKLNRMSIPTSLRSSKNKRRKWCLSWLLSPAILAVPFLLTAGCGDGRPNRVAVSGKVLIDGKPMEYGIIQVLPAGHRAATGTIQPDGSFTLGCYEKDDGCVTGTHPVRVDGREPLGLTKTKWHAPKHFAFPGTSRVNVTIDAPTDELVVELSSGGEKAFTPFVEVLASGISDEQMEEYDQPY